MHRVAPEGAPIEDRDDEALMVLVASDHRRAFELIAGRHLGPLTGYCAKFLGSPRAGEELAQDVLVEAWSQRRRYRPQGRFRVFLLTIARTRCLNRLREDRRRGARMPSVADMPGAMATTSPLPGQLDELLEQERQRQVRSALLELPPKLREAVLLRFDHGLDYAEIARIVGRPEATMRSRVFHALKRLRATLSGQEEP